MTRFQQGDRPSASYALSRLLPLLLCFLGILLVTSPDCFAKPKAAPPSKKPSPGDILGRAHELEAQRQYDRAAAAYQEYLAAKPSDDKARSVLADILSRQGKLDEAVAEYETVLAQYPDRLSLSLALAGLKARQKKFQDAQTLYKKVLSTDPNSLAARRGLADALYLSGQRALALPHYETFYTATKDATVAELIKNVKAELLERARALDAAQRYKEAAAAYREYLASRPDDDDARSALARTLALQGLLPEAVALYQEVLSRHPSNISALVGVGKIFIWQKNPGSARSYYEEVLRIEPGNLDARRGMADVLYWSGKDQDALRAYEEVFARTQDAEAGQRVRELRGEQLGTPRAPIGKTQLLPTLPFRDYIKAGYGQYTYTQGIADERDYLLEASTSIGNHTLVGRLERLHRFNFEDIPVSAELYSPLWDKAWGSLNILATASPNFAPNYIMGGEIFQGLGVLHQSLSSLEISASYKRLAYGYRATTSPTLFIPSVEIDVLSPSLTYYLPYNLWLTEKLFYIPQTGSITLSSRLTWRPINRLEAYASGAFGTSGERIIAFQDFTRAETRSYQGGVIFPITESFSGEASVFYEDRGFLYIRRGGSFNLIWHF